MTSSCSGISLSRPGSGPRYLCTHIQEVGLIRSCGSDDYAFTYFWLRSLGLSGMVIFNNPCSTREAICIFRFFDWLDIPNLSIISLAVRGTVQKFKISLTLPARMSSWLLFLITLPFSWLLFLVALPFSWLLFLVTFAFFLVTFAPKSNDDFLPVFIIEQFYLVVKFPYTSKATPYPGIGQQTRGSSEAYGHRDCCTAVHRLGHRECYLSLRPFWKKSGAASLPPPKNQSIILNCSV